MAGKAKANATAAMALATAHAVRLLQDPETRAQLLQAGSNLSSQLRQWYLDRQHGHDDHGGPAIAEQAGQRARLRRPASLFAQDRLERRTVKLASTLDLLRASVGTDDTPALDGVDDAIMRIHVALRVAQNLPFSKRARAHREIGATLATLEAAVVKAALGTGVTVD